MSACEHCQAAAVATIHYGPDDHENRCARHAWRAVTASGGKVTADVFGRPGPGEAHPVRDGLGRMVGIVDPIDGGYGAIIGRRRPVLVGSPAEWIVGRCERADTIDAAVKYAAADANRVALERAENLARVALLTCAACGHSEYDHASELGPCGSCACGAFT